VLRDAERPEYKRAPEKIESGESREGMGRRDFQKSTQWSTQWSIVKELS
jgi:hypothetical protein